MARPQFPSLMTSVIDPRGNRRVSVSYDANGRACQEQYADGGAYRFYYITADQVTRPQGQKLLAEAKAGGPITAPVCSSPASFSPLSYTVVVDPNGNPTTYRFNNYQKIISVTDAQGQTSQTSVNPATNLVTSRTDALGRTTKYTYDNSGNMTSMTDPAGNTTFFEYEPSFNKPQKITDALGQVTLLGYDGRGNLTSITDPMGNATQIAYDRFGQPTAVTDPLGNTSTFEYDERGNLTASADPLGNRALRSYDGASRLIGIVDPNGRASSFHYDLLDRVTRLQDGLGKDTAFEYDPNGNLLSVTDANGNRRSYAYDPKNRLESSTDPLGKTEVYAYDFNDNLTGFRDRRGRDTTYAYDWSNRRVKIAYDDGGKIDYNYDIVGRLTRIDDSAAGPIEYGYATFGCGNCAGTVLDRVIRETTPLGTVHYAYDEVGRRKTMSVAGGPAVDYSYDAAGRLTRVSRADLGNVDMTYDQAGRRTSLTLPNGVTTHYAYDRASRLLNINHSTPNSILEDLTYTYDGAGNRISFGKLTPQAELPRAVTAAYNAANQLVRFNDDNLTYDDNGNLTSKTDACGTTSYTWDARNRLVAINGFSSSLTCSPLSASFKYDALGKRIEKSISGKTIQYLYDGLDIVAEIENGVMTATYLRSLNIDEAFARVSLNGIRYYQADGLGSTVLLTDSFGEPVTMYSYDAYGNTSVSGETNGNPFQYTSRENDGTGLYYYRARYYSPEWQRFITKDPIGFAGGDINLYRYVQNNPINRIDPLGLQHSIPWPIPWWPALPVTLPVLAPAIPIIIGVGVVLWPSEIAKEDAWEDAYKRLTELCHKKCVGHLGKDRCSQGNPYTNCMKECMKKYGFGYPSPSSPMP